MIGTLTGAVFITKAAPLLGIHSDARFEIVSLQIASDTKSEYVQRALTSRTASFYGANLTKQAIYFTVFVRDLVNGQIVACDPEVLNVPT